MNTPAPPPLSAPVWLDPRRLVVACVVIAGAVAAVPALARIDPGLAHNSAAPLVFCTAVLSWLLAQRASKSTTPGRVIAWSVLGGAVLGSLNAGLVFALSDAAGHDDNLGGRIGRFLLGTTFGSMFGGPLGAVFGAAYSFPLAHAVRARLRPTGDSIESVLTALGSFLALVGVFAGWRHGMPYRLVGFVLVVTGAVAIAVALLRDVARFAWLSRVRAGRIPDYRLRARDSLATGALVPIQRVGGDDPPDQVIERGTSLGEGPFRHAERWEPIALAHSPERGARALAPWRIILSLAALAIALAGAASNALSPWNTPDLQRNSFSHF